MPVSLTYDSSPRAPLQRPTGEAPISSLPAFGSLWSSNLHRRIVVAPNAAALRAVRGAGYEIAFVRNASGGYDPDADIRDRLVAVSGGYHYFDFTRGALESYSSNGRLSRIDFSGGGYLSFSYTGTSGMVSSVEDHFGRTLTLRYTTPTGSSGPRVTTIIGPRGETYELSYLSDNLRQIQWPDLTKTQFAYDSSALPWALTGVTDESEKRYATIGYDTAGRAQSTQLANGVNGFVTTYTQAPSINNVDIYDSVNDVVWQYRDWILGSGTSIRMPNGTFLTTESSLVAGVPRLKSQSQAAGSGCSASVSSQTFDANANLFSRDDFNGNRTCYAHDLTRNLEVTRVDGLAGGTACTVTDAGTALPTGSRKTSTQWHSDWSLRTAVAEPGRLTSYIYNGQPDPLAGGIAACAPAGAMMPDGKPIAVLCRQVERATTDADGSNGFSAQLDSGVATRVRSWTYDQYGRVLTETDPRAKTTTYSYYTTTIFSGADPNAVGYSVGDLQSVTDAAGLTTSYPQYDKAGNWLQRSDPNSVVTTRIFYPRQLLASSTTSGLTTLYEYWPTGLLKKLRHPDNSWVFYTYDDAHRLWTVEDNLANKITYTLDNFGNRTVEEVKDAAGVLRRQLGRGVDALGRVQQVTGRE